VSRKWHRLRRPGRRSDRMNIRAVRSRSVVETLHVNGDAFECLRIPGPALRVPIVFLHEGLGSVSHWRDFPYELCRATGRAGFVYSRLGYGQSGPARPRRPDYFIEEGQMRLPAILDAAGIDRAVLFGHSDGASIAIAGAASLGSRVAALVLVASHVFTEHQGLAAVRDAIEAYSSSDLRERLGRHHRDVDRAFYDWADAWLDPAFLDFDLTPQLEEIGCPALVIQGLADPYGTITQTDAIAAAVPGPTQRLDLADTGHSPHREVPDLVISTTVAFLDRHVAVG